MNNMNEIKIIDLKSPILKIIFSFLNEKKKLNIIIYNKKIQKKLEISIKNYEKMSKRYKIGERNGKGKEYDKLNDKLIFEGEYLNGKRNGKGKEYNNDLLIFEGEYLKGERWNGKGFNINNEKEFEIKNGKGYIKEYDYNCILEFEGEYLNGERNGKGKEYYLNKVEFEGEYLNGK